MPRRRNTTSSNEDDAEHQLPGGAEMQRRLEEIAEIEPHGGADQRSEQGAGAADRGLHHELARGVEHERVRRHEALHQAEQTAGEAGIGGGDDEGGELVAIDMWPTAAARSGLSRMALNMAPTGERTMRSASTKPTKYQNAMKAYIDQSVLNFSVVKPSHTDGRGTPGKPFSPPVIGRQRIELDEKEHLGDRHRDHGEIDAGAPERDEADQIADHSRRDRADEDRHHDVGEVRPSSADRRRPCRRCRRRPTGRTTAVR